jgi:hypothetical protein
MQDVHEPGLLFEVTDEEGVLRLVLRSSALIDAMAMKDILRTLRRLDPIGGSPVLVEQQQLVRMTPDAKVFLARVCTSDQRPVAFIAADLPERIQGEFFLRFHKPEFPFRLFNHAAEALQWFAGRGHLLPHVG